MSDSSSNKTGFFAFLLIFILLLILSVSMQKIIVKGSIYAIFPQYNVITDVFPSEWIIMDRDVSQDDAKAERQAQLTEIFYNIKHHDYDHEDTMLNALRGKKALHKFVMGTGQMLYFVNPYIALMPMHLFFAGTLAFLLSLLLPGGSNISWIRQKALREYERIGALLRKQFEAHNVDLDPVFDLPPIEREDYLRSTTLPEIVISEIADYLDMHEWVNGRKVNPVIPVKFYFRYRISETYGNLIQGLVSGGAAILIFVIGLRGLKLIPSEEPSLILMALSVEFVMLIVLMLTFAGSGQEERLDRVVKELEAEQRDAIKLQTDTLHEVLGGRVGKGGPAAVDSLAEYEEQKLLDEVLSLMLKEAERKRSV